MLNTSELKLLKLEIRKLQEYDDKEHKQLKNWLKELQEYKKIGTVEECRIAMGAERGETA